MVPVNNRGDDEFGSYRGAMMKVGLYVGREASVDGALRQVRAAAEAGLDSVFFGQTFGWDSLVVSALAGREAAGLEIGTAIVPTYPRHPIVLAAAALTLQAATGNRFTLGLGPSHGPVVESRFGLSYEHPARHVREYLSVLGPLLRGEQVDFHGETLSAQGAVRVPDAAPPPVLLSALAPLMLRIAGELADGTVTTWATAPVIAEHVKPRVEQAAADAGRGAPRIAAIVMASVTDRPEQVRRKIAGQIGAASNLPSYRALLERQGLAGIEETIVVGDAKTVAEGLHAFDAAGTTDLLVSVVDGGDADGTDGSAQAEPEAQAEREHTLELLSGLSQV
jgi:F420-dependent oxidoreductase-like protein